MLLNMESQMKLSNIDNILKEYYENEFTTVTLTEHNIYDMVKATLLERLEELQNGRTRNNSPRTRSDI